jgi:hypothetical protein
MTTIVSAFLSNVNSREDKNIYTYYDHGKLLISSTIPKIIFLDEDMFDLIGDDYDKNNTLIIKIDKYDSYLDDYKKLITNFEIHTTNSKKDTIEYMLTMCNKTEWIKRAILLNHFNSDNFIWVDFGIKHVFKCSNDEFIKKINNLHNKNNLSIRIASIWNLEYTYNCNIYKDITWYFAGGVFGGNKNILLKFAEYMEKKCIEIITEKNTIMWEVNIWYLIYCENKELFDGYSCDHNDSIIDNY